MEFKIAKELFNDDRIWELCESIDGLRFLKLRSLRKLHLEKLFELASVEPTASKFPDMLREAYETNALNDKIIDQAIAQIYKPERANRRRQEPELINQLYRLEVFDWGGLHQNSLEKTIVDNYIKKIRDYNRLAESIENELHSSMRGYVLCSWYNHWTSIIIEDIFRDHPAVLPAVGSIKKIDFFVNGIPFDLKVTYFPEGYIKACRKQNKQRPELTLLKKWARKHSVPFSIDASDSHLLKDLWTKANDHPSIDGQTLLSEFCSFRKRMMDNAKDDPSDLIKWLYQNQGVRRFDASNRLFLILIDSSNFFDSWKLKRARPLLESRVKTYLDAVPPKPGRFLEFFWGNTCYSVLSDAIIITKPDSEYKTTFPN